VGAILLVAPHEQSRYLSIGLVIGHDVRQIIALALVRVARTIAAAVLHVLVDAPLAEIALADGLDGVNEHILAQHALQVVVNVADDRQVVLRQQRANILQFLIHQIRHSAF